MIPIVLAVCALMLLLAAGLCFVYEKSFLRSAVRTQARIVRFVMMSDGIRATPIVEFCDESGAVIQRPAQRTGAGSVNVGDEVPVLYTRKRLGGLDAWNIFIAARPDSRPFAVYRWAGWLMGLMGIVFAAVALMMGM